MTGDRATSPDLGPLVGQVAAMIARVLGDALTAAVQTAQAPLAAEVRELRAVVEAMQPEAPPSLVSVAEAARLTGLSGQTLRTYAASGRIPSIRVGRAIRLDVSALRPPSREQVASAAMEARRP